MKHILIVTFASLGCIWCNAQTFTIPAVPDYLSHENQKRLYVQQAQLIQQKSSLTAEIDAFNAKCTGKDFPEGDPLIGECNGIKAKLDDHRESLKNAITTFKNEIDKQISAYTSSAAVESVKVTSKGNFYLLTKDGKKMTGADNIPLNGTVTFVTGNDGHAEITFKDGMNLSMGPNSTFVPETIEYDRENTLVKAIIDLKKGALHWISAHVSGLQQKKLRGPMAVCSVRGTDFEMLLNTDGSEQIKLYSGELEITEIKTGRVFPLKTEQMVKCSTNGIFTEPVKLMIK